MVQNVDYTLVRGTAIGLSEYLADTLESSITSNRQGIADAVTSALNGWNMAGKLSPDDVSDLTQRVFSSLQSYEKTASTSIRDEIKDALIQWQTSSQSQNLPLSAIRADFESNKSDLTALLQQYQDPAFTELLISGTGAQLIHLMATAMTMNQVGAELAVRENFVTLAQQASSVFAALINQGIRLPRKNPAMAVVSLTTTDSTTTIPPYAQFSINGTNYYNRDQIFFTPKLVQQTIGGRNTVTSSTQNLKVSAQLYQGTITTATTVSNGTPFMQIEIGNRDWAISNKDILVFVDGVQWSRTATDLHYSLGLYNYDGNNVWTEYTTATGNCIIQFGDGVNGNIPQAGSSIVIYYAVTSGSAGNSYNLSAPVACSSYPTVSGIVTDYAKGGFDERSVQDLKAMAPTLFSAQNRPCSISDYNAFACNYPGVIDSVWLGQQQFAPEDPSQAMIIKGVLLTSEPWTDKDMSNFRDWLTGEGQDMTALCGANIYPELYQAKQVPFNVQVQVYVKPYANENQIRSAITSTLNALYKPRFGVLNRKVALSDMEGAIKGLALDSIDYFDIQEPTSDLDIAWDSYGVISNITIQLSPTDRRS